MRNSPEGQHNATASSTALNVANLPTLFERLKNLTTDDIRTICYRHFSLSRTERSRASVEAALLQQSVEVQSLVLADCQDYIQRGKIKNGAYSGSKWKKDRNSAPTPIEGSTENREIIPEHDDSNTDRPMILPSVVSEEDFINGTKVSKNFMKEPNQDLINDRIKEFIRATSNEVFKTFPCGSCAREINSTAITLVPFDDIPNCERLKPERPHPHHILTNNLLIHPTAMNPNKDAVYICSECLGHLKKNSKPPLSLANDMWIGDVPYQLRNLTLAERTVLSKHFSSVYVFKLFPKQKGSKNWDRAQMYNGLKGNVSTYKMDPAQMASVICDNTFPRPPDILSATIAITFVGPKGLPESTMPNIFKVRRWRIRDALIWLKEHNPLYNDITISEERLGSFPENGIPDELSMIAKYSPDVNALNKEHDGYVPDQNEDDEALIVSPDPDNQTPYGLADQSAIENQEEITEPITVPIQALGVVDVNGDDITSSELMAHAIENSTTKKPGPQTENFTVRRGSAFVNEYARVDPGTGQRNDGGPSNANHLLGCFPTLFPFGKGGFETHRQVEVPYELHVRWCLAYSDRRFRKDIQFPFQVFGVCQKREICRSSVLQMKMSHFTRNLGLINTLKPGDLVKASTEERRKITFRNPAVRALRKTLVSVRTKVKGTDESRHHIRAKIWGTNLIFNPPSLWITINPADTQDPIAQVLAGVDIDLDAFCDLAGPSNAQRAANVAQDPLASAQFFHFMIKTVIEVLFGIKKKANGVFERREGILGRVQSYLGTVEAQGRGTLHLHMLIWLEDAPTAGEMQDALKSEEFRKHVANYIRTVVKGDLNGLTDQEVRKLPKVPAVSFSRPLDPTACTDNESQESSKKLVRTLQFHQCSETTCLIRDFKKNTIRCKRRAPFAAADTDWINEDGEWGPKRLCTALNNWNPALMATVRSNHDIKLIINGRLTAKLTYYITNYATKKQSGSSNVSALLAETLAFHKSAERTQTDLRLVNRRLIQRCANALSRHREFSAPEIMSYLMGWKDTYESHTYVTIYWSRIVSALKTEFPCLKSRRTNMHADPENDSLHTVSIVGDSIQLKDQLRDYSFRGESLSSMNLLDFLLNTYEGDLYGGDDNLENGDEETNQNQARRPKKRGRPPNDRHQYLATANKGKKCRVIRTSGHETLPKLSGGWFNRSDRPNESDLHQASMLALLKPWRTLSDLKRPAQSFEEAYTDMMNTAGPKIHNFVSNAQYYYECADGAREPEDTTSSTPYVACPVQPSLNSDRQAPTMEEDMGTYEDEDENEITEESIELRRALRVDPAEKLFGEAAIDDGYNAGIFRDEVWPTPPTAVLGQDSPKATVEMIDQIKTWDLQLKQYNKESAEVTTDCQLQANAGDVSVTSCGESEESTRRLLETAPTTFENTTGKDRQTHAKRPCLEMLNEEQRMAHDIVEEVLQNTRAGIPCNQLKMLILGQGGTGKSLLIAAITETFEFYNERHILAKCGTTGIAATNIGGETLHSWAGLPMIRSKGDNWIRGGSVEIRNRRRRNIEGTRILIVDEMSMLDKGLIYDLSQVTSYTKAQEDGPESAHKPFGGMHVILCGDFHQFPPVGKANSALYVHDTQKETKKGMLGRQLFLQFDTVVELEKQMRTKDIVWIGILDRLRIGQCNHDDVDEVKKLVLNNMNCQKPDFSTEPWDNAILVTPRHAVRELWNEQSLQKHCKKHAFRKYIIPSEDFETSSGDELPMRVRLEVAGMKDKTTGNLRDSIQVAIGMKAMVQVNFAVGADIANGTRGKIEGIVLDERESHAVPDSEGVVRLAYPPAVIFFKPDRETRLRFDGVPEGLIPITPSSANFKVTSKKISYGVTRKQYAITPGYAFTDYKSQGQTIEYVIIDLGKPPRGALSSFGVYVALSRSRGRDTIRILRGFDETPFQTHPSEDLYKDMVRLREIRNATKRAWNSRSKC